MTAPSSATADNISLSIEGGIAHFPGLAAERTRLLAALNPARVASLLEAVEATEHCLEPACELPTRPDARTYHVRLVHAGRSRQFDVSEPFQAPELAELIREVRGCVTDR